MLPRQMLSYPTDKEDALFYREEAGGNGHAMGQPLRLCRGAHKWLLLAAGQGNKGTEVNMKLLAGSMTAAEIALACQQARQWMPKSRHTIFDRRHSGEKIFQLSQLAAESSSGVKVFRARAWSPAFSSSANAA
jgi:hypothetical protein